MFTVLITTGILLLIGAFFISVYNELTKERILVEEAWSGVGTYLQQRNDVIPNMVEIVKGYAGHENKTLTEVTKWRNKSAMATSPTDQIQAEAGLSKALLDFYQVAEQYPDLKANQNFLRLQEELAAIEEKINTSRRYYNANVREFNQSRAVFPKNIVSGMFGFREQIFYKEDETARNAPKIQF